jgi:regulator of sirC expression with transglutaminase-like and TPR domain
VSIYRTLRFIKRKEFSYNFWIAKDSLWHAERTDAQKQKDQIVLDAQLKKYLEDLRLMKEQQERANQLIFEDPR